MPSLIHELDNDALLLLYLAGELPDEDRLELEQMLATDAGLRAELEAIRRDGAAGEAALAAADHVDPPAASPSAQSVALRRVGKAMRQWQVDQAVRARPAPVPERQPRFPMWLYPVGAVACLLLGTLAWWGWQADPGDHASLPGSDKGLARLEETTDPTDPTQGDPARFAFAPVGRLVDTLGGGGGGWTSAGDASGVFDAEGQARSLVHNDDEASVVPTIVQDGLAE